MLNTIEDEIRDSIDQSQRLVEYYTDKENLMNDIVAMATDNIHGFIHEKTLKFPAFNHEVTLYVLEEYAKKGDINRIYLSDQDKETLNNCFGERQWEWKIPRFYHSIYTEAARIYHIRELDLIQLQMNKQRRNQKCHFNSLMGTHGNKYFTHYFPQPTPDKRQSEEGFLCEFLIDYPFRYLFADYEINDLKKMFKHCCEKNMDVNYEHDPTIDYW
jgi:hypothetical protein